ncbi:MAG: ATP-binding protein [Armatimonadetes bacterium]|nr:ATP-binding protein [Armatimonadota bacterium]
MTLTVYGEVTRYVEIPRAITSSRLWASLDTDPELLDTVARLRTIAIEYSRTLVKTVPDFTDHSAKHMDGLWAVSECVLTEEETAALTPAEAFLVASGFYLHDAGMAYAATEEGRLRIESSAEYGGVLASFPEHLREDSAVRTMVLEHAVRCLHADAAVELATGRLPGTELFLFDAQNIRDAWGITCGQVAASHAWSLDDLEVKLGSQGVVPLPGNRAADLGFAACVLRLIDAAHINRDRASKIDRAFRDSIAPESLLHWLAQENIDGPTRDGADLVYRASQPIVEVDVWWLCYELLRSVDREVRSVRHYLDRRSSSRNRLSLQGVRGAMTPEEAAVLVPTSGFLPIEVNLRTGSIERLVQLLAGETLYGPNPPTAVRELLQNSRDAVMLKAAISSSQLDEAALSIPIHVTLNTTGACPVLEVQDWGVGMTRKVMTEYLISVASDYWSSQFNSDFPQAAMEGFQPAGRFGIGFLSVFMLGDEITVTSNREGDEKCLLALRGVGRRGELRLEQSRSGSGTTVTVNLRDSVVESLRRLDDLVRFYAPVLPHDVSVEVDGQVTKITKGWIWDLGEEQFLNWTLAAVARMERDRAARNRHDGSSIPPWYARELSRRGRLLPPLSREADSRYWVDVWPQYRGTGVRLLACQEGVSLLCIKGMAVQPCSTPGFVGVIDIDSGSLDVSRNKATDADVSAVLQTALD